MKLSLSKSTIDFLTSISQIEESFCDLNDNCMDKKISIMLIDFESSFNGKPSFFKREYEFIYACSLAYSDGRSCPGSDRKANLMKLINEAWRKDLSIVQFGIRYATISLEYSDIAKINM